MNSKNTKLCSLREKGLADVSKSRDSYARSKDLSEKEAAFKQLKKGLETLIQYMKGETNARVVSALKQNTKKWMLECQEMANEIKLIKGNMIDSGKKTIKTSKDNQTIEPEHPQKKVPKLDGDLELALKDAIVTEKPNVRWDDVSGLEGAKQALSEAVILPTKFPNLFDELRQPWKGILLYGPPGTGKTLLAKACATEANATFFSISASNLMSKYVGESEKLVKTLFQMARERGPSIIFIDEIDSVLANRSEHDNEHTRRVKTEFLIQMEGIKGLKSEVFVLGATNLPWDLDTAVRRRFEKRIYIPLPELDSRENLIRKQLQQTNSSLTEEEIKILARITERYSGSDITNLIKDACMEPLRKATEATAFKAVGYNAKGKKVYEACSPKKVGAIKSTLKDFSKDEVQLAAVRMKDFKAAISRTKATVSSEDLKKYEKFTLEFGQKA